MVGRTSALLKRDIGDPLVVAPTFFAVTGYLHQAVALPGVRVRILGWGDKSKGSERAPGVVGSLPLLGPLWGKQAGSK
jgi:hypothetical protein